MKHEVTTAVGHFKIPGRDRVFDRVFDFPVRADGPIPDYQLKEWRSLFESIADRTGARVVILNHARDLHGGYRPFGAEYHNAATGENLDGWELQANAMEVVNSGAQQTDMMRLCHDWLTMLNRGTFLTPVGSSDSHDVSRFIIGQGRTYIRCRDAGNAPWEVRLRLRAPAARNGGNRGAAANQKSPRIRRSC